MGYSKTPRVKNGGVLSALVRPLSYSLEAGHLITVTCRQLHILERAGKSVVEVEGVVLARISAI